MNIIRILCVNESDFEVKKVTNKKDPIDIGTRTIRYHPSTTSFSHSVMSVSVQWGKFLLFSGASKPSSLFFYIDHDLGR